MFCGFTSNRTRTQSPTPVEAGSYVEMQYPQVHSIWSESQWRQNWKCILLTSLTIFTFISIFWCNHYIDHVSERALLRQYNKCDENLRWVIIFCTIVLYSFYMMECSYAVDTLNLCNKNTKTLHEIKMEIEDLRKALPIIWWKATCFHYKRRKRRTMSRRGVTCSVSTRVVQERVNTYSCSSSFDFTTCGVIDISNKLVIDRKPRIIKFYFTKGFGFATNSSEIDFQEQRTSFIREMRHYDDYAEVQEGYELTECSPFGNEEIVLNSDGKIPWFANPFYYWLSSCFLLSWPHRLVLLYNTAYVNYKIMKLFGANSINLRQRRQTMQLELMRTNSYITNDTDTPLSVTSDNNAENSTLVPTYSEALLIDYDTDRTPNSEASYNVAPKSCNSQNSTDGQMSLLSRTRLYFREPLKSTNIRPVSLSGSLIENPPSYEEALRLPVLEQFQHSNSDEDECTQLMPQRRMSHARSEIRLPSSRPFLSIETSL